MHRAPPRRQEVGSKDRIRHLTRAFGGWRAVEVTLPRLKRANISTTFYAISGDSLTHANGTYRFLHAALQNIDALRAEMAASQGQMKLILHHEDLPAAPTPDTVHFVLSFEGGKPLEGCLENLRNFYCLGLRAMQITWNLRNELADGVKEERTGGGLTNFGEAVVREMERLGMVIDLAHISRAGWFDVLDVASGPVCCSHSNCKKIYQHFRTIDDEQIKALAQTGGVLGVNAIATMVAKEPTLDKLVVTSAILPISSASTTSDWGLISSRTMVRSIRRTRSSASARTGSSPDSRTRTT